jgi:hypothetical protein
MTYDSRNAALLSTLDCAHHDAFNCVPTDAQAACNRGNGHFQKQRDRQTLEAKREVAATS